MNTEGAWKVSVLMPFDEVMLFTLKIHLLIIEQILIKIIKQDNSIVKLNISNLCKAIITTNGFSILKKESFISAHSC